MTPTESSYFSKEAEIEYMGSSQFKSFMDCEARTIAEINGEYIREGKDAFMEGNFVEAYFENTLDEFITNNPGMVASRGPNKGELKANFKGLYDTIKAGRDDPFWMEYMTGQSQVIKTGEIAGVKFKTKIDRYIHGERIVDLKVMKDFKKQWKNGAYTSFIEFWGYDTQAAIYQAVEGNHLPFYIAGLTKEKEPDHAIFHITQDYLDLALQNVIEWAPYFKLLKDGFGEPKRCEKCDYCKSTKKLKGVIDIGDIDI